MTVASTTTKVSYSGNGTTTVFTVPFYFLAAADLRVILRSGATETVQTLTTQYTVTGAGVPSGGTVTMLAAPASGTTLTILRNVSPTQETDLLPNDRLPAESLETALDKATMLIQQLDEVADRALQYPASDAAVSPTLPAASARASKFLSFDASGNPVATVGTNATASTFLQAGAGAVTRSVNDKLRDVVSVKDFGAVGDGLTDDTAALQAAIDAASGIGGAVVSFPVGVFLVTSVINAASNVQFVGSGIGATIIKMSAASSASDVIFGTGLSNVRISGLSVDVNGTARAANPSSMSGIRITVSTNVVLDSVEVFGALGSVSSSAIGAALAQVTRGLIINSVVRDCGSLSRGSDGFYCGPNTQSLIHGCVALNCTDSAFVLESCNQSGIVGCTARGCRVGGAISVAFNGDCYGNYIDGLTIYDWSSAVSGGLYFRTTGTGSLFDTKVSNVIMRRVAGSGPAVQVYNLSPSSAVIENITFSNVTVNGAGTQAFLISGASGRVTRYVTLNGCQVLGALGSNGLQVEAHCADVQISNCFLSYATSPTPGVAILVTDGVRVTVQNCKILGDGSTITYGAFFAGTNSNCAVLSSVIISPSVATIGADTIATIQRSLWVPDGGAGKLQIGADTVLRARLAAVSTVSGTAGGSYGATEQAMINDLKTAVNDVIARLNSSTGHGLIT